MKKLLLLVTFIATAFSLSAQTQKGDAALVGNIGYQTDYKRFAIGVQGRYNIINNLRIAPDVTLFIPKDKVTGLDVNVNAHYVFKLNKDILTVYPLAGFGMQNNMHGKRTINVNGTEVTTDSKTTIDLAFNLGGGISYKINSRSFLNAEAKFMFGDNDNAVILIGYGYQF